MGVRKKDNKSVIKIFKKPINVKIPRDFGLSKLQVQCWVDSVFVCMGTMVLFVRKLIVIYLFLSPLFKLDDSGSLFHVSLGIPVPISCIFVFLDTHAMLFSSFSGRRWRRARAV